MQSVFRLEDAAFASGAKRQVRMQGLAVGKRIRRISLYVDLSGTKDAADALDGDLFPRIFSLISLQSSEHTPFNLSGFDLWRQLQAERGRVVGDPTDIPGSGTTFTMQFQMDLPFRIEDQLSPDDGSLSTALFASSTLDLQFAAANVWAVGNLLVTAGNVRVVVEYAEGDCIPQLVERKYLDLASGLATLEPGVINSLVLVQTDYSTITQAEIALVGMTADEKPVIPQDVMHEQLVTMYNQDKATQSGTPHELAVNAARFIPLVWMPRKNGALTKQPAIEKAGQIRVTSGTLTTPRALIVQTLLKNEQKAASLAVKAGAPEGATRYEPAVASKSTVRAVQKSERQGSPTKKARLTYSALAGKMRTTPTASTK